MAYPYTSLPTGISDTTTAVPNTHSGHHNSVHGALNDLLTELGTAPHGSAASLTARLTAIDTKVLPAGGTTSQVLAKTSGTDYAVGWTTPSAGGGTGGILGSCSYNPGTVVNNGNTGTLADLDATNLVVTFTAPSTGKVVVVFCATVVPTTSNGMSWTIRESTTELTGVRAQIAYADGGGPQVRVTSRHLVTGLTASSSHTYKWAQIRSTGSGTPLTIYGGQPGPALMEVWPA